MLMYHWRLELPIPFDVVTLLKFHLRRLLQFVEVRYHPVHLILLVIVPLLEFLVVQIQSDQPHHLMLG